MRKSASLVAPARVRGQVLVAGYHASPIPFPEETRRDWVARAGDDERLTQVNTMFMTRPVEPSVLERFGRQAAKAAAVALDETLKSVPMPPSPTVSLPSKHRRS